MNEFPANFGVGEVNRFLDACMMGSWIDYEHRFMDRFVVYNLLVTGQILRVSGQIVTRVNLAFCLYLVLIVY